MVPPLLPNLSDVDIRFLRVFQAVVRNKGFAAAQNDLGVTSATISTQISHLEQRLGVRLCERGRGGFSLTDEGKSIFEASQNLFRSLDNFRSVVGSVRGELVGEVHFGTVDAMLSNPDVELHKALGSFAGIAPKVILHTEIAAPQDLFQGLAEDRYHLILVPAGRIPQRFHAVMMFDERQSLYCGRDHELFNVCESEITVERLATYPYAARSYMPERAGLVDIPVRNMAITSHMESSALLTLSGKYLSHLPTHFARQWVERGEMRCLLEQKASYLDRFHLVYRKREKNRIVKILFDCIGGCIHRREAV